MKYGKAQAKMKYSFSFLQISNWLYVIYRRLKTLRERLDKENVDKEEAIKLLEQQKAWLLLIKEVLNKNTRLIGIQRDFLKNLEDIKREFGVE
jgi:hypothetical protein